MLVPDNDLNELSIQVEVIETPGATISGLVLPSLVGPLLLNVAIFLLSSTAPTVNAPFEQPGDAIVPASGPLFPAATITTTPLLTILLTARDIASLPSQGVILAPRLKLTISAPLSADHSRPLIISEL